MGALYHVLLYQPMVNILVFLYNTVALGDLGAAIIILTLVVRLAFFPLFQNMMRQQTIIQKLKPEIDQIEKEHKGDLEKKGRAQMELYKKHNVNPFSMIFVLFLQILILIPLFQIFHGAPTTLNAQEMYSFISLPASFNTSFLGLVDLQTKSLLLVILASFLQYLQSHLSFQVQKNIPPLSRRMAVIGPLIVAVVFWSAPAAFWLYLLASNLFSVGQQVVINRELTRS